LIFVNEWNWKIYKDIFFMKWNIYENINKYFNYDRNINMRKKWNKIILKKLIMIF